MAKDRNSDPAWVANPLLVEVQEALREVQHIQRALKQLEAAASKPTQPCFKNEGFMRVLGSSKFSEWLASLNETHVALIYLATDPRTVNRGVWASWYLKSELDKADRRWNNDISRVKAMQNKLVHDANKLIHDAKVKAIMDPAVGVHQVNTPQQDAQQRAEDQRKKAELDYWREHEKARKELESITEIWLQGGDTYPNTFK
jgi:hypothetical protein